MKKIISFVICTVMVFCAAVPAFAESGCDCGFSPVIYVGPLGCTPIVRDAGAQNEQQLWKVDTKFVLSNLIKLLPEFIKGFILDNKDIIADAIVKLVNACLGDLALDNDGNSRENVTTPYLHVPLGSEHGPDSDYYFDYDFRLDPYEHADRLHEYIQQVKALTRHDSVKLKCSSLGGAVLSAYLDKYGYEGIDVIILRCSPLWGTAVAGEAFCGKIEFNAVSLLRYGEDAIPYLETGFADDLIEGSLYAFINVLKMTGVFDALCGMCNDLVRDEGDKIYSDALIPIFATMPGIWAFVPNEYFDDAVEFMKLPSEGGLHDKVFAYRNAMANIESNLKAARADGVKVCIICGYNVQRTPLVTLWKSTSDGTVDTKYASLGATCAQVKQALGDDYINALESRDYLSADNMIDASTCALRDCTWFVRDWLHCNGNSGIDELFYLVMTSDEVSITSFEKFPQFLEADDNADTVYPVTGAPDDFGRLKNSPSFLNLIRYIFSILKKINTGLFAASLYQT